MTTAARADADAVARSWVEQVRGGGSQTWAEWAARHPVPGAPEGSAVGGPGMPGAAQLEVVRRLAASPLSALVHDFAALADLVLARTGPGRGMPELPLAWPSDGSRPRRDGHRVGAHPVDPGAVPVEELVRITVGTLGELVLDTEPAPPAAPPRRRPWSRQFHVAGPPVAARRLRAALRAAGHVEGGRRPQVLLLAPPLDEALRQAWTARVMRASRAPWRRFVDRRARNGALPPGVDLPRLAAAWADRVGVERVHVLPAGDDAVVRRTAAEVLRLATPDPAVAGLPCLPSEVDVVRRLNSMLRVRLPRDQHRLLLAGPVADVVGSGRNRPLRVPDHHRGWVDAEAERVVTALSTGGYPVHGDLDTVRSSPADAADRPSRRHVLDAALAACLRAAARREARPREGAAR